MSRATYKSVLFELYFRELGRVILMGQMMMMMMKLSSKQITSKVLAFPSLSRIKTFMESMSSKNVEWMPPGLLFTIKIPL